MLTLTVFLLASAALGYSGTLGREFDIVDYKKAHPERFQHEFTTEEIAVYRERHPEHSQDLNLSDRGRYTAAELAAYKEEHPDLFDHRSHQHSVAAIAAYRAANPERFERFDEEDCKHFARFEQGSDEDDKPAHHHNYSAVELVTFTAGMAHARQVAEYKKAHPESIRESSAEAIEAYKKAHPERVAAAKALETYTKDELDIFKAGFEHYNQAVAPHMAEHPDAFSAHSIAEYIFAHPDRFANLKPFKEMEP